MKYVLVDPVTNKAAKLLTSTREFANKQASVFKLQVVPVEDSFVLPLNAVYTDGGFTAGVRDTSQPRVPRMQQRPQADPFSDVTDVDAWVNANVTSLADVKKVLAKLISAATGK
jgi:hypothetical protein